MNSFYFLFLLKHEKESLLRNLGFAYFHAEEYEETIRVFKKFHELIIALFNQQEENLLIYS